MRSTTRMRVSNRPTAGFTLSYLSTNRDRCVAFTIMQVSSGFYYCRVRSYIECSGGIRYA